MTTTGQARAFIWMGSEWPALRAAFTAYLDSLNLRGPGITVLAESVDPVSMPSRIAGWIQKACADAAADIVIQQAGTDGMLPNEQSRTLIGVTELLLDPDPTQADQLYAIGLWTRIVPRRKRWLMRVTPYLVDEIVENAAAARPGLVVQVAEWKGQRVVIASRDLIAAEVVGRALRIVAQPAGDVGINPWETDLVRIASERLLGATSGPRIALVVEQAGRSPSGATAEFRVLVDSVARMLDCGVEFRT